MATTGTGDPPSGVRAWLSPGAGGVLATRALGVIMRAYRQANRMTQQQLADLLGYDRTYISMIECGRRAITDRETLTRIARKLAIPPHALGVAEPDDGDFTSMMEFGASVIRLAEVARHSGRAAEAVNELWPLITGLETRIAAGHAEHQLLILLTQARAAFGIALGHLLPDEQLATAARWTGKALRIAQHIGDRQLLAYVLRMHGNELRKAGHPSAGAMRLQHALRIGDHPTGQGSTLVLLARAAAEAGYTDLFDDVVCQCLRLLDAGSGKDALFNTFTVREVRLRGLLATGRTAAAATLAARAPEAADPPTPQWRVIERITTANVMASSGDAGAAAGMLATAITDAETLRLPHQVQRVIRLTTHSPRFAGQAVGEQALGTLSRLRIQLAGSVKTGKALTDARPMLAADGPRHLSTSENWK
jgi:transcriptional regulator with XRE-family HTH domain